MKTTLLQSTLSDGSKTYSLAFVDGSDVAQIECENLPMARKLQLAFEECALHGVIRVATLDEYADLLP